MSGVTSTATTDIDAGHHYPLRHGSCNPVDKAQFSTPTIEGLGAARDTRVVSNLTREGRSETTVYGPRGRVRPAINLVSNKRRKSYSPSSSSSTDLLSLEVSPKKRRKAFVLSEDELADQTIR